MNLMNAKRKIQLSLDAMSQEQYEAVKRCIIKGGGLLLLTPEIDERTQICINLQDVLEFLFEDCQRAGLDFEQVIANWKGESWETTIACLILQGNLGKIKEIADSI
jgi:hypothetical protein